MVWRWMIGMMWLSSVVCAHSLPDLGDSSREHLTPAQEAHYAAEAMYFFDSKGMLHSNTNLKDYIEALGERLVAANALSAHGFRFFVIKDSSINAFAMPAAHIGVHSGLIFATQTESELASVLAHEMAHISQRHLSRGQEKNKLNQWLMIGGMIAAIAAGAAGKDPSMAAAAANVGTGMAVQNQLAFSREFEREADRVGLELLSRAGFDPQGMPDFFERLLSHTRFSNQQAYAFLSTHPVTQERLSESQNRVKQLPVKMHLDSIEFQLLREQLRVEILGALQAQHYYLNALQTRRFSNEAVIMYGLAWAAYSRGQASEADRYLKQLRERGHTHRYFSELSIKILMQKQRFNEALAQIRALKSDGFQRSLFELEIACLFALNRHHEAAERLDLVLNVHKADGALWRLRAQAFADRDALNYHFSLGRALESARQFDAAMAQYRLALATQGEQFYLRSMIEARILALEHEQKK